MTMRELTKISGISPSTISMVLNGKPGISQKTRDEVLELVDKYHYIPIKKGKPATPKDRNILFLRYIKDGKIVEENSGFITVILDSIEMECRKLNYNISIINSENNLFDTLHTIDYDLYDGIIVLGTELDQWGYQLLKDIPIPYVVVDNSMDDLPCNCVVMDNEQITYRAVEYLAALGHKEIAYFSSADRIQNFKERGIGFHKACQDFHLTEAPQLYLGSTLNEACETALKALKTLPHLPSCAFVDNDTIAIGVMGAIHRLGYKIPQDISLVGFDDIHYAMAAHPPLTTMRVPKVQIGKLSLLHLCTMIDDPDAESVKLRVSGSLIVRESTKKFE